jgi:cysteine synthase
MESINKVGVFQVTIYSISNFEELKNLYFHDDELQNIVVNYMNKEIRIHLVKTGTQGTNLKETGVLFIEANDLHVPMIEPWGSGFYVNSIEFKKHSDKQIRTKILLNSGDEITCVAETIKIE